MNASTITRIALTLLLLYGVYTETGIWTALALFLVFGETEIAGFLRRQGR